MNETLEDSSPWEKLQRLDFFYLVKMPLSAWLCLLALVPLMMQKEKGKKNQGEREGEKNLDKKSVSNSREEREGENSEQPEPKKRKNNKALWHIFIIIS